MTKLTRILITLLIFAADGFAESAVQAPVPRPANDGWCATGPSQNERIRLLHQWNERRVPRMRSSAASHPSMVEREGIFFVETDPRLIVGEHRFDLEGKTLILSPAEQGWSTEAVDLLYEMNTGTVVSPNGHWNEVRVDLQNPVTVANVSSDALRITSTNSILLSAGSLPSMLQWSVSDVITNGTPIIAPLMVSAKPATWSDPVVSVREDATGVLVTWRSDTGAEFDYDIQAWMRSDGTIHFNYREVSDLEWGATVVSGGRDGSDRPARRTLVEVSDPADGELPELDARNVKIETLGETSILDVTITTEAPLRQNSIPPDDVRIFYLGFEGAGSIDVVTIYVTRTTKYVHTPRSGWIENPSQLRIVGNEIRLLFDAGDLVTNEARVTVRSSRGPVVDIVSVGDPISIPRRSIERDLSVEAEVVGQPLLEVFRLGELDVEEVWERVREVSGFRDETLDAIAIYQNFFTDIILYAGAYSAAGNAQVQGVRENDSSSPTQPRRPNLLHMNRIGYRHNETDPRASRVLAHELGHRWLYFFRITEDGGSKHSLNPISAHPAQYVHTPAAFPVYTDRDSSTMGGANFIENPDGSFSAPPINGSYGYSWHDLYLMGLATPEEVEPWFYIRNSSPELGGAYYPPDGIQVTGERVGVTVDQIVSAMGPRLPVESVAEKQFDLLYVLLVRDLDELSDEDVAAMVNYREVFRRDFVKATGGRGNLTGNEPREHRRAARRRN